MKNGTPHNRKKKYIIPEGEDVPPLIDLGVFTKDGKIVSSMQNKYRQINRFLEMVSDVVPPDIESFNVIDYGCGKSYLTFILYYYLTKILRIPDVRMTGLDEKPNVIASCNAAALKYGYSGLKFVEGGIAGHSCADADMVVALHACDTATDYALYNSIISNVKVIFIAPCCQHELNGQIKSDSLALLYRYGIVKERIAALVTDAIRANLLASRGYLTQLMEFVELTHTPKNLLLRAVKTKMPLAARDMYLNEVTALCGAFSLEPALLKLLKGNGISL